MKLGDDVDAYQTQFVGVADTRDYDRSPQWYMKNRSCRMSVEFKSQAVMGIDSYGFCVVVTFTPWYDSSGGFPKQIALCSANLFFRIGKSNDAWNDWAKLNP